MRPRVREPVRDEVRLDRVLVAVGVSGLLAVVAYSWWVIGLVVGDGLDHGVAYVSEMAATSQPLWAVYSALDAACGVVFGMLGVALLVLPRRRPNLVPPGAVWTGGATATVVFGVAVLGDGLLPMECTPSTDPVCRSAEEAGTVGFAHAAHVFTSAAGAAAILLAMVAMAWWLARRGSGPARSVGRVWLVLAGVTLAVHAAMMVAIGTGTAVGLVQRVALTLVAAWLASLAGLLLVAGWKVDR